MSYEGSRQQINKVNLATQNTIPFQTGLIQAADGTTITQFYTNGWRTYYDGLELLPGKATFRVDGVAKTITVVDGTVNTL